MAPPAPERRKARTRGRHRGGGASRRDHPPAEAVCDVLEGCGGVRRPGGALATVGAAAPVRPQVLAQLHDVGVVVAQEHVRDLVAPSHVLHSQHLHVAAGAVEVLDEAMATGAPEGRRRRRINRTQDLR
eukprot:CAMPEP_0170286266 /NCGR_PEP_ID=MMETSP0116_2-20130129/43187_1 /TAXON_ID=400756 /ORGANISM="Durinskia baltica, Strain CSIRO CS-38" /LENGTH=128 /DNA_ID=CAMNT_0010537677 /DNA_START=38 /DNA_END=420 /DNA_ORIENTATION=+